MKKLNEILKVVWFWVTGKYKDITSEDNINAAIKVTNAIKNLAFSGIAEWAVAITGTGIDDRILNIIKQKIPGITASLLLLRDMPDSPTNGQVQHLLESFLKNVNADISDRQRLLTSLTAELIIALEDGRLTFGEAAALAEKYYRDAKV